MLALVQRPPRQSGTIQHRVGSQNRVSTNGGGEGGKENSGALFGKLALNILARIRSR